MRHTPMLRPQNLEPVQPPTPGTVIGIVARVWDAGWPKLKRWWAGRQPKERIKVILDRFDLSLYSHDRGRAGVTFKIVNFTERDLKADRIEIYQWLLCDRLLRHQDGLLQVDGGSRKRAIGDGYFAITLDAADVRDIVEGVQPASNRKSSPRVRVALTGSCVFKSGKSEERVYFDFGNREVCIFIPDALASGPE